MHREINFFFEDIEEDTINLNKEATKRWLFTCLNNYKQEHSCELTYIFVSDEYLLQVNKDHLNHDYYTDIITFNYNQDDLIAGDMFISIDRIIDNAKELSINFEQELRRVIVHGMLHLIGFNDKTEKEQEEMTQQEDICLAKY